MPCNLRIYELMPADTLTLPQDPLTQDKPIRAIPQDVPNLSWGGKYQSFHWWKLQDVKLWMLSCHIEKVVGKYEADRLKEADERWRALVGLSSRLQGFRGHPGPARPSLPLTGKIPPPPHTHTHHHVSTQMSSRMSVLVQTEFLSLATKIPA